MTEKNQIQNLSPLVSVIMPVYNQEQFISVAIKSVLEQTYKDWELIIVDDGSTDNTLEVISKFKDPRIHLVSQSHVGLEGLDRTYNKALSVSRGDLVAILEGDDFWPFDKLVKQIKAFEDPEVVLSFGLCLYVDEKGNILGKSKGVKLAEATGQKLRKIFLFRNFIPSVTVMIKKEALLPEGFIEIKGVPFVDFPTWFVLTYKGRFAFVDDVLGYWRRYSTQTSAKLWMMEKGEINTYIYFWRKGYISLVALVISVFVSITKYIKRLIAQRLIKRHE